MLPVKTLIAEQFHHENKTWIRLLDFFKEENSFMKNRLSVVLDNSMDKSFLALAEQFQNKFILKDEYIDELRHDVKKQDGQLSKVQQEESIDDGLSKNQGKLRNEMDYFEKDFNNLKSDFNKYLSSVF